MQRIASHLIFVILALVLHGCASSIPKPISTPPPGNATLAEVRNNTEQFIGTQVRWGGAIDNVENRANETLVEIVGKELNRNGRPIEEDKSQGRFVARINGFLDPAIYAKGRLITVSGTIKEKIAKPIGEFMYSFPVVDAESYFLWQPLPKRSRYDHDPFWYYDPWFPYPYPWWHRPYYW